MAEDLDSDSIYAALLRFMNDGDAHLTSEIERGVADLLQLDPELRTRVHSGNRTSLGYKLAWARTRAKKSGLLERIGPSLWRQVR